MAATIRFSDGLEARLPDATGKWECADAELQDYLRKESRYLIEHEYQYSPDDVEWLAIEIAKLYGAQVIYVDPLPPNDDPPDTIY